MSLFFILSYICLIFLQKTGNITYNGENLDEFYVKRTSAYISQTDNHIAELTVRETLDFAARCQGASEGFAGFSFDYTTCFINLSQMSSKFLFL